MGERPAAVSDAQGFIQSFYHLHMRGPERIMDL